MSMRHSDANRRRSCTVLDVKVQQQHVDNDNTDIHTAHEQPQLTERCSDAHDPNHKRDSIPTTSRPNSHTSTRSLTRHADDSSCCPDKIDPDGLNVKHPAAVLASCPPSGAVSVARSEDPFHRPFSLGWCRAVIVSSSLRPHTRRGERGQQSGQSQSQRARVPLLVSECSSTGCQNTAETVDDRVSTVDVCHHHHHNHQSLDENEDDAPSASQASSAPLPVHRSSAKQLIDVAYSYSHQTIRRFVWRKKLQRGLYRVTSPMKKNPTLFGLIFISFLFLVLILLLLIFLIIIPYKIQSAVDLTVLDLLRATISEPSEKSFKLEVESSVQRALGTSVTLKEFEATVRYAPAPSFESSYNAVWSIDPSSKDLQGRRLSLSPSLTTTTTDRPSILSPFPSSMTGMSRNNDDADDDVRRCKSGNGLDHREACPWNIRNPQSEDPMASAGETTGSDSSDIRAGRDRIVRRTVRTRQEEEDKNQQFHRTERRPSLSTQPLHQVEQQHQDKRYYSLGTMRIPSQHFGGLYSTTAYTTTFQILDSALFDTFLRELVTLGHADWVIHGYPAIRMGGLTFYGTVFEKPMFVRGPQLHVTEDDFLDRTSLQGRTNRTRNYRDDGNQTVTADGAELLLMGSSLTPTENVASPSPSSSSSSSSSLSSSSSSRIISIPYMDMTSSTTNVTQLHLQVQLNNMRGLATVDPVGVITVQVHFQNQPILQLSSSSDTALKPGVNRVDFVGHFKRFDDEETIRQEGTDPPAVQTALSDLLAAMLKKDPIVLEVSGVSSSIGLFSAAIQAIHLYTVLDVMKTQGSIEEEGEGQKPHHSLMPKDQHLDNQATPMLQEMKIKTLELIPTLQNASVIGLQGTWSGLIQNPFGAQSRLEVPNVLVTGVLVVRRPIRRQQSKEDGADPEHTIESKGKGVVASFTGVLHGIGHSQPVYRTDGTPDMGSIGIIPANIQTMDFHVAVLLDLSDGNSDAFREFARAYIQESSFVLSLLNVTASLSVAIPSLGPIKLKDIPMDRDLEVIGFNGFKGMKVNHFAIESIPFITSNDDDGIKIAISVVVPSEAAARIYLGRLYVDLQYQGSHLAYLTATNCKIVPGENVFNFTGRLRLKEIEIRKVAAFGLSYMSGSPTSVDVELLQSLPTLPSSGQEEEENAEEDVILVDDPEPPEWLKSALAGVKLSVDLPGRGLKSGTSRDDRNHNQHVGGGLFGQGGGLLGLGHAGGLLGLGHGGGLLGLFGNGGN